MLGARVRCVMDRPLGSAHPRYPDMIYPVNYGYVPGVMAGDGAEQDVYVIGPTVPLKVFDGVVVAVVHRFDDCEDKWVVAEQTGLYSEDELRAAVAFQEKYYKSQWIL
ncbi:inorganic diphosphatase [Anaeromassilibacillus senegalensis]|uniref:inorganic diphosphatase n=1 Tax=Anaeromassilibacillus senegalensis TaxID=1673717 RepID=A0ABS9CPX9_9FIRM|nr:inorganic diphosphatase [Anaeromassilibacillus senegalensis]